MKSGIVHKDSSFLSTTLVRTFIMNDIEFDMHIMKNTCILLPKINTNKIIFMSLSGFYHGQYGYVKIDRRQHFRIINYKL